MNLEELGTPSVVEELSLNEILNQMKAKFVEIAPEFTAYVESDPLIKLMEVAAYRELLLRQRINQAAKANLLAFATGTDLDSLASFYGLTRKDGETDEEFRKRIQAKIEGWSSAGSKAAYKFHALNSDSRVKEVNADSPVPGLVRIAILSKENGGVVSEDLLKSVNDYMQREDIRVLTDTVQVVGFFTWIVTEMNFSAPAFPKNFLVLTKNVIVLGNIVSVYGNCLNEYMFAK